MWKWTGVQGAHPASVARPTHYTLEFKSDGRYAIRADCNSGAGSWTLESGDLSLNPGPLTQAMCGEDSLDRRFLQLLASASGFAHGEDRLELTVDGGAATMIFVAMPQIELAGTSWLVRGYNNGREAVVSVLEDTELTMEFAADSTVAGAAGCNRFTGAFETVAQTVSFGPLATTRMMCMGEGVVEQEDAFLAALGTVDTWEIRGERAQLRTAGGALAVDLVSAITGSVFIRTRQALPEDAVLNVQLQDVSRADVAAIVLGESERPLSGADSQFRFEVSFDPAEIDRRMSYALRATVSNPSGLLYTTTKVYPVLTRDSGQFGLELELEDAGR